jgi:predicted MPP superfamily phosphohydrolase
MLIYKTKTSRAEEMMTARFKDFYYSKLTVRRYVLATPKLKRPVRLAHVSDLHGCLYGNAQEELLAAIDGLAPHAVAMTGDIIDERRARDGVRAFLRGILGKYPAYYVFGNHEARLAAPKKYRAALKAAGVTVLSGGHAVLETSTDALTICGIDDPELCGEAAFRAQLRKAFAGAAGGSLRVLLTHRPEKLGLYAGYPCDLALAGHAHGGQFRLPGLVNGLYAPNQGVFPRHAGGLYVRDGVTMIVSRGLARESTPLVPRVFNPPELVLVELVPM